MVYARYIMIQRTCYDGFIKQQTSLGCNLICRIGQYSTYVIVIGELTLLGWLHMPGLSINFDCWIYHKDLSFAQETQFVVPLLIIKQGIYSCMYVYVYIYIYMYTEYGYHWIPIAPHRSFLTTSDADVLCTLVKQIQVYSVLSNISAGWCPPSFKLVSKPLKNNSYIIVISQLYHYIQLYNYHSYIMKPRMVSPL